MMRRPFAMPTVSRRRMAIDVAKADRTERSLTVIPERILRRHIGNPSAPQYREPGRHAALATPYSFFTFSFNAKAR